MTNTEKLKKIRELVLTTVNYSKGISSKSFKKIIVIIDGKPTRKSRKDKDEWKEGDTPYDLSEYLYRLIKDRAPTNKRPNLHKWSCHMDSLIRLNGADPVEIKNVIDWSQVHPFWSTNILSTDGLRRQYTKLVLQMKQDAAFMSKKKLENRAKVQQESEGPTLRQQLLQEHMNG